MADFNNLPVKVVNSTVVFATSLSSTPRRRRPMWSDGRKGILMSVLKIRLGVRSTSFRASRLASRSEATLPPGVDLKFVGDQSDFVNLPSPPWCGRD